MKNKPMVREVMRGDIAGAKTFGVDMWRTLIEGGKRPVNMVIVSSSLLSCRHSRLASLINDAIEGFDCSVRYNMPILWILVCSGRLLKPSKIELA